MQIRSILLLAILARNAAAAGKNALKGEDTAAVCNLATALRGAASKAKAHISTLGSAKNQLERKLDEIKLLAKSQNGGIDEKLADLAAYINKAAKDTTTAILDAGEASADLADKCGTTAGRLTEFVSIFAQAFDGSKWCITQKGGTTKRQPADIPCLKSNNVVESAAMPAMEQIPDIAEAYATMIAAIGSGSYTANADKCKLTNHDSTTASYLEGTATTAAIQWAAGLFTTNAPQDDVSGSNWRKTPAAASDSTYKGCIDALAAVTSKGTAEIELAQKITQIEGDGSNIKAEIKIPKNAIHKDSPKTELTFSKAELKTLAKELKTLSSKKTKGPTSEQTAAEELRQTLTHNETACNLGRQQPSAVPIAQPQVDKNQKTCEKKGKENNCKDGCKWDGEGDNKKCVVDTTYKQKQEEGAKEGVTATNTTGSNSFVIHKTPLLLAFFLF
uniref:Variant surface glycoprotein 1125.55 n=1 Tax=Trypanosoma brucei TaxID=5691 RepID=A0A1J0R464_9TRYP|nr:variant surface glycoprotein 1125.55 [Trypanosoma brucei]